MLNRIVIRGHLKLLTAALLLVAIESNVGRLEADEPPKGQPTGELKHSNAKAYFGSIQYTNGGNYLITGDYPEGTVDVWELQKGKRVRTIDTGFQRRGYADFVETSSDKRILVTSRDGSGRDLKNGGREKTPVDVRLWDLDKETLIKSFAGPKDTSITFVAISPDGTSFVTLERMWVPGRLVESATLWNAKTGGNVRLSSKLKLSSVDNGAVFAPDGKSVFLRVEDESIAKDEACINAYDAATGKLKYSIRPGAAHYGAIGQLVIAPNSEHLIGSVWSNSKKQASLKVWRVEDGKDTNSIVFEKLWGPSLAISPDGSSVAAAFYEEEKKNKGTLVLFKFEDEGISKTASIPFDGNLRQPVFNPSGNLVAVTSYQDIYVNGEFQPDAKAPLDILHLVDVQKKTLQISARLPDYSSSMSFRPDGQQIAVGVSGRVLLFDLALGVPRR